MTFEIEAIADYRHDLKSVLDVYEANKDQLGFLPTGAFEVFIERNELLVAHDKGNVRGYILFRCSKGNQTIRVTHLCVAKHFRGKGVATRLVENLKQRFKDFIRITARCRVDFDSWHFWHKRSGFAAGREIAGKKSTGSTLTEFFWEPNELPLFRAIEAESLPCVVIDANVFFDLYDPARSRHDEALGLLEDWLSAELQLCVTTELHEDVKRSQDDNRIRRATSHMGGWRVLSATDQQLDPHLATVQQLFGVATTDQAKSDQRHLAIAMANDAVAFVTRDSELQRQSEAFFRRTGISISRPSQIILEFDVVQDNDRYQHRELEQTNLNIRRFDGTKEIEWTLFRKDDCDRVAPLKAAWHDATANPRENDVYTITGRNDEVLAVMIAATDGDSIVLSKLRIQLKLVNTRLGKTLLRYLLGRANALFGTARTVTVTDNASYLIEPALESHFIRSATGLRKISIPGVLAPNALLAELEDLAAGGLLTDVQAHQMTVELQEALAERDVSKILEFETRFCPLKVDVDFVDNYVIPIKPRWAKDLFDPDVGPRELWGRPIEKILNPNSVYYKDIGGFRKATDCCRLIWYVSDDKEFPLAKHLRASSVMTKRVTDKADTLYRRYRRLGIYEFTHVREIPGQRNGNCEALEFCTTEN